jgi:acyl-CoA reductase-like NAD-dependent aldehyde dehydrogenase
VVLRALQHFPFQGFRDSGIGSQGIKNSLALMVKHKATVINLGECHCVARAVNCWPSWS